jgi:hypothetical protein
VLDGRTGSTTTNSDHDTHDTPSVLRFTRSFFCFFSESDRFFVSLCSVAGLYSRPFVFSVLFCLFLPRCILSGHSSTTRITLGLNRAINRHQINPPKCSLLAAIKPPLCGRRRNGSTLSVPVFTVLVWIDCVLMLLGHVESEGLQVQLRFHRRRLHVSVHLAPYLCCCLWR